MEHVGRRTVCSLGFLSFTSLIASLSGYRCKAANTEDRSFTWDVFLRKVHEASRKQNDAGWEQEPYVQRVADLAARFYAANGRSIPGSQGPREGASDGRPDLKVAHRRVDFEVVLISFDAGEAIPFHDHAGLAGIMLCASGEVDVQSCELLEKGVSRGSLCHLRPTQLQQLKPGALSTLTARRNSIHQVVARRPSEVIDIFTPPYTRERDLQVRWYQPVREIRTQGRTILQARVRS